MNRKNWLMIIITAAILLHPSELLSAAKTLLSLFIPFYIGLGIAYLLAPFLNFWERTLLKKIRTPARRRTLGLLLTYLAFAGVLAGAVCFLLPKIIEGGVTLLEELPTHYNTARQMMEKYPLAERLADRLGSLLPRMANLTLQMGSGAVKFLIGAILSVYFLHSKERLLAQAGKLMALFLKEELYRKVLAILRLTHHMTRHFILARLLDSLLVAGITYLFMLLFQVPYAILSALIIGCFNTIPYFGSILGAIPPAVIILLTKPSMLLPYLIYIFLLEQLDGNVIGPKLQGKQVGLSPLWVIFAVFLFGGLFGFAGMVLGVPVFAVIYYLVTATVNDRLRKKGKSSETADYAAPKDREMLK